MANESGDFGLLNVYDGKLEFITAHPNPTHNPRVLVLNLIPPGWYPIPLLGAEDIRLNISGIDLEPYVGMHESDTNTSGENLLIRAANAYAEQSAMKELMNS